MELNKDLKTRERDMMSRRRARLDKEMKREFDAHYGKPRSTRGRSAAGKGDQPRPQDKEMADLGWLSAFGKTKAIREEAAREWRRRRDAGGR